MIRKVSICLVGIVALALCWSCGTTTVNVNNASSPNKASASNIASNSNATRTGEPVSSAATARKAEVTTTADALYKEYKADFKSMYKYEGKVVEISGKYFGNSGTDDSIEVKFDTGEALKVNCRINASAVQAVAKLEKGQQIKMTGIGDPSGIIGPLFKDCQMAQ
jgi:hypothetical protein